jgi:hypothetical protein
MDDTCVRQPLFFHERPATHTYAHTQTHTYARAPVRVHCPVLKRQCNHVQRGDTLLGRFDAVSVRKTRSGTSTRHPGQLPSLGFPHTCIAHRTAR